jgi:opacity protein-like surface antigen
MRKGVTIMQWRISGESTMRTSKLLLFLLIAPSFLCAQPSSDAVGNCQSYLTVQGFRISSLGDFRKDWKEASGGYVGYGLIYPSQWGLAFQTGYISFRKNPGANLGADPSFTIIPFMAGGRYYFLPGPVRPYLLAMSGLNVVSRKYVKDGVGVDASLVKVNTQIGVGLQIGLFSKVAIELAGKYNSHNLDVSTPYNVTGIEYGVAFNWVLHK